MRRVLVLAAMAALVIGSIPSVAGAARATRTTEDRLGLGCLIVSEEQGTLYMIVQVSDAFGAQAGMVWWQPGHDPTQDPPSLISGENTVDGSVDGNSLGATMQLYTYVVPDPDNPDDPSGPRGDPAGQATLSATLEAIGDPVAHVDELPNSNAKFRAEYLTQELAVTGSVTLPDVTYDDLSSCQAMREHVETFATNPSTRIERFEGLGLSCEWADAERNVFLIASTEQAGGAFAEVYVTDASGEYTGFSMDASLDTDAFSASWDLMDIGGEMPVEGAAGSASVAATLSSTGERGHVFDRIHGQMMKFFFEIFAVSGELTLTTAAGTVTLAMDDACSANTARVQTRFSSPNGPKGPHGKRLPNDLPENAAPIQIGESVSVRTGGAAAEPEAGCVISVPEVGDVEVPISHTGWWTFNGTGGDVTVDTAGSSFDTVVGVYVLADEGLVQVGCVDDVGEGASLQAAITVGTDADVTYYIQAGGFGDQAGQLELAVR